LILPLTFILSPSGGEGMVRGRGIPVLVLIGRSGYLKSMHKPKRTKRLTLDEAAERMLAILAILQKLPTHFRSTLWMPAQPGR